MLHTDELDQLRKIIREENEPLNKRLDGLEQGQAQIKTVLEALEAGQKDMRENMATKADMQDLGARLDKKLKNHERRIENLEEHTGISNPHKN